MTHGEIVGAGAVCIDVPVIVLVVVTSVVVEPGCVGKPWKSYT